MGFFDRISTILKSNLNDLVSRAENPQRMLDQAIADMQAQLAEAKIQVARSMSDLNQMSKDAERHRKTADHWEQRAMQAVRADRDDLAHDALIKKKEHEEVHDRLDGQVGDQQRVVDELKNALKAIVAKIDEAKRERQLLTARVKRAEAQRTVAATLQAAHDPKRLEPIAKLTEHVDRIEAEAEARAEVASLTSGLAADPLEREFKKLDAGAPMSDDLAALKRKMRLIEAPADTDETPPADGTVTEKDGG